MSLSAHIGKLGRKESDERQRVLLEILRKLGPAIERDLAGAGRARAEYRCRCVSKTTDVQVHSDLARLRRLGLATSDTSTRPAMWSAAEVQP